MKLSACFVALYVLITVSCDSIIPDLPRGNPLDKINDTTVIDGISLKYSRFEVVFDDNKDGIVNKGEDVYLKVYIKNYGTATANSVKATISTDNSYISYLSPTSNVDYNNGNSGSNDISPGNEKFGYASYAPDNDKYTVKFKVSDSAPSNTVITFNMTITDNEGNSWSDNFTITVEATGAVLNYSKNVVVYDDNKDGIINKGETAYLKVYVKNNGTSTANGVRAVISTGNSYISQLSPTLTVDYNNGNSGSNDISPGSEKYGYASYAPDNDKYTVKFKVSGSTPANTVITFNMGIFDSAGNLWTDIFIITVF